MEVRWHNAAARELERLEADTAKRILDKVEEAAENRSISSGGSRDPSTTKSGPETT
ncbi:MAG: hypothetical protein JW724_02065 [Candidatus Altiarchaeota archaeon]|nr:hypothetical protein [Candidatus Altiarchaeota archaeon]